jgi:alpha-galactosidase
MSKKIAFIGAGSLDFTRDLAVDILSFEALSDCEIALMDIDAKRLSYAERGVARVVGAGGYKAKVTATTDRRAALRGADGVLITILQGGVDVWRHDIEIPAKYGVDLCVGDTRGPAGVFRFLRTVPAIAEIARDIEEACPGAIVLNYTNPMAMLVSYLQSASSANVTGLCHSVQGTAEMIAGWIGAELDDVSYTCVGINHQAFYLEYRDGGKDALPRLREAAGRAEVRAEEPVRMEMFRNLGYFPTESSGHNSEYNPWFRKRPDLIEKYCTHGTGWNPGEHAYILKEYMEAAQKWEEEYEDWIANGEIDLSRGGEYAANIFNAVFGDGTAYRFNANIKNKGYVSNLDEGACVEVPAIASRYGIEPVGRYTLPPQLSILINHSAKCEELAVRAAIEGDPEKVFHAILFDPLTASVLSMEETRSMVKEMLEKNSAFLKYFKSLEI